MDISNNCNTKILFIDDDKGLWSLISRSLRHANIGCENAASKQQAIEKIQNDDFDLLLIDYQLPDGIGLTIIEHYANQLPCILITAMGDESIAVKALQKGAKDYIVKDVKGHFIKMLPELVKKAISLARVQNELNLTRTRLRKVFDHAPDLMIVSDSQFKILDISQSAALKYQCEDLCIGASLTFCFEREVLRQVTEKEMFEHDVEAKLDEKTIPFKLSSRKLSEHEWLLVFRNMTDAYEVEKAEKVIASINQDKDDLMQLNRRLAEHNNIDTSGIIGLSKSISALKKTISNVADTDANVLIIGETGTGKELVAKQIHVQSARSAEQLVKLNCAAIPENLVESELFGHAKGAFTGAIKEHKGRFEQANGGSLFLDEIGELSLPIQVKLLRVLQEAQFEPVGSNRSVTVDVRIIAATNRNLAEMVALGTFRADLFYRLNVIPLTVPPLRDRADDIGLLVQHFIERYAKLYGREKPKLTEEIQQYIYSHDWPGNIRELQNFIERLVVLGRSDIKTPTPKNTPLNQSTLPAPESESISSMAEVECNHIMRTLKHCRWRISGVNGAAELLDLNPSTLRFRMRKHGITRSDFEG